MKSFGLKTLLKTCIKTIVNGRNFTLKILVINQLKWGIYNPFENLPVAAEKGQNALPVDRSTGQRSKIWPLSPAVDRAQNQRATALWPVDHPVDRGWKQRADSLSGRPPGRPEAFPDSRALWRSTDPVDRPPQLGCVHALCTSVDRPGRPLTATVDRQPASQPIMDLKTWVFIFK